jgi:hypothetical protein
MGLIGLRVEYSSALGRGITAGGTVAAAMAIVVATAIAADTEFIAVMRAEESTAAVVPVALRRLRGAAALVVAAM